MELRHLEHFLAVAEERSFTRAAARLHVAQSALSISIKSLERDLGARLFDRTTRHVALTDEGSVLVSEARATLVAAEVARDAVAAVRGGVRGTLRIGIMQSLTLVDLAGLLTRFHRERPHVRLVPRPASGGSMELVRDVADGHLEVAFAALADYPPGVTVVALATEQMVLVCPDNHRFAKRRVLSVSELGGERFVDHPAGWGTRMTTDKLFLAAGIARDVALEVPDISTVIELVKAGFGCAVLAPSLIANPHGLGQIRLRPTATFAVSLVTATRGPASAATRAFIDLARSSYVSRSARF